MENLFIYKRERVDERAKRNIIQPRRKMECVAVRLEKVRLTRFLSQMQAILYTLFAFSIYTTRKSTQLMAGIHV